MTRRLTLICQGATAATRVSAFPADDPLEELALRKHRPGPVKQGYAQVLVSPSRAAQETATLLGLSGTVEPALQDMDVGRWAGQGLANIAPEDLARWLSDPDFAGHGGESLGNFIARAGDWLNTMAEGHGAVIAVTSAAFIRACIGGVLSTPFEAFWRIDIAPLTETDLRHDGRRWALRALGRGLLEL
ncbi:histidine phosphatase family protein [Aestuariivirga sp.]|uniref:histidine phosphatase family protein n=1 Tax=Aestuariivirga sp. TaxID=2650926 RepID=UPI0039E41C2A